MRPARAVLSIVLLATALLVALAGCRSAAVEYIPEGGTYTLAEVQERATSFDVRDADELTTAEASAERVDRLVYLRKQGDRAAALADALTTGFPTDNASVPVLVEHATVDEREVWVVVEVWGEPGGRLTHRRLWLLDYGTLDVVNSSSFS
jgi:hypothetical protein